MKQTSVWLRLFSAAAMLGVLLGAPTAEAATQPCTVSSNPLPSATTFPITSNSTGPVGPAFNWTVTFVCDNGSIWSAQTNSIQIYAATGRGAVIDPAYGLLFPTGVSNLYIHLESVSPAYPLSSTGNVKVLDIPRSEQNLSHSVSLRAQFVVSGGAVPPGSSSQISPLTLIQNFYNASTQGATGSDSPPWTNSAIATPSGIKVVSLTCKATNVAVPLPPVTKNLLASGGATAGTTPFTVDLTGCPAGTQLKIGLSGNVPAGMGLAAQNGVVASTGTTASEVAVRVLYGTDPSKPVDIGGNSFTSFIQGDSKLTIAYSAQYYALKPVTKGGTVSAVLTYTLSYP